METDIEYVRRKLNDVRFSRGAIAKDFGMQRFRLDKIAKGGDANVGLVELLAIYLRKLAE